MDEKTLTQAGKMINETEWEIKTSYGDRVDNIRVFGHSIDFDEGTLYVYRHVPNVGRVIVGIIRNCLHCVEAPKETADL